VTEIKLCYINMDKYKKGKAEVEERQKPALSGKNEGSHFVRLGWSCIAVSYTSCYRACGMIRCFASGLPVHRIYALRGYSINGGVKAKFLYSSTCHFIYMLLCV
jgi:hypothetical protein